ncbi:MAG: MarR family transcriptional regulator, partial [Dehalococcoidia bacterium]|nr:MarR family transcriptional regulator [Dehalococcoidia bacterium]
YKSIKGGTMDTVETTYGKRELWALLDQATTALSRVADNELSQVGITMIQGAVLYFVKNATEPVTPAQIGRWLFREPNTVSQLLKHMEKQGLIKRTKDLDYKNRLKITLTEKGEQAYQKQTEMRVISDILSSLSPEECDKLGANLKIMRDEAIRVLDSRTRELPFP